MLSQLSPLVFAEHVPALAEHLIKDVFGWKIHISNDLLNRKAAATEKALELLALQLQEISQVIPPAAVNELRKIPLWFSPEYSQSTARAEYYPDEAWLLKHGREQSLAKSVEFTNIAVFESVMQERPNFLLHELTHAYHDLVIKDGYQNAEIKAAYEKAKSNKFYSKVEQRVGNGRAINSKTQILQSPQEYFAACSEAYFSTNDSYPFQREQLAKHDPEMYGLVRRLWGVAAEPQVNFDILQRKQLGEVIPVIRWLENGDYTTLRSVNAFSNQFELIRCSITGTTEVLVSTDQLLANGDSEPLAIEDYELSKDLEWVLIYTNSVKVWRKKTRGDYWILQRSTGKLRKLGPTAKPSTLMFAKLSPTGTHVGYVCENNIFIESVLEGAATQITTDGSPEILNGLFDWVYEEEFHCRDGWRWSPDGQHIAFWQLNTEAVKKFTMVDYTIDKYPVLKSFAYPKTGELNSTVRIGVCSLKTKNTVWLAIPGNTEKDYYLPRMEWVKQTGEIILQRINRRQNAEDVMLADPNTGNARIVITERDNAWLDIHDDALHWNQRKTAFTWISERDGWRQLYEVSADGTTVRRITSGQYDVCKVLHLDEKNNRVFYLASPNNGTQRFLFCDSITGKKSSKRLTPQASTGWHEYTMSPDGKYAVHTYSDYDNPPKVDIISLPNHKVIRSLIKNESLAAELTPLKPGITEFFQIDIGDDHYLDGWLMKPANFDPSKKYPILFYVYGEPAAQAVTDQWNGKQYLWHLQLTNLGYVVACIDNRGTPSPRGREWRKAAYRNIGTLAAQEQVAAAKELLKRPYLDGERVGVWGWSGGGSATLNLLFRYPEIYRVGMAVASVPDMRLYNTIYQERYMGLPQDNAQDYIEGSPITHAHGLRGNLLIVHGTGDDNCHHQGMEKLVDRLIELNLHFSMMSYPNRGHALEEGNNTTRHLYEMLKRYLLEHLPAGPK